MLARSAEGLYWMSRYLERAEHACRLLANQIESLNDSSRTDVARGWRRILTGLSRSLEPGGYGIELDEDALMFADAYTVADDLTFDPDNPDSIRSCVASARENARQFRHAITEEMWLCVNEVYLGIRDGAMQKVWGAETREFYLRTEDAIRAFRGIAESGIYRDHGWHFLELGRFLERAQLLSALLEAQLEICPLGDRDRESDWVSLLRACDAHAAFRRLHSLRFRPVRTVDFLVADGALSHSIRFALGRVQEGLEGLRARRDPPPALEAERLAGRMLARIYYDWPSRDPLDESETRSLLSGTRSGCAQLHHLIGEAYFHYPIEDDPGAGGGGGMARAGR